MTVREIQLFVFTQIELTIYFPRFAGEVLTHLDQNHVKRELNSLTETKFE